MIQQISTTNLIKQRLIKTEEYDGLSLPTVIVQSGFF